MKTFFIIFKGFSLKQSENPTLKLRIKIYNNKCKSF